MTGVTSPRGGETPRILVIDDDPDFCTSTRALLEAQGYLVAVAGSVREGLQQVKDQPPDLVVLDIIMDNDWSGYEVNQALRFGDDYRGAHEIPIIMASSVPVDPALRFCMAGEVGMVTPDAYVTKPVDIPRFLELVRQLIQRRSDAARER
jgi:CheY-like chemotaxis protein